MAKIQFIGSHNDMRIQFLKDWAQRDGNEVTIIYQGYDKRHVDSVDTVVYADYVPDDNVELAYAKRCKKAISVANAFGSIGSNIHKRTTEWVITVASGYDRHSISTVNRIRRIWNNNRPTVFYGSNHGGISYNMVNRSVVLAIANDSVDGFYGFKSDIGIILDRDYNANSHYKTQSSFYADVMKYAEQSKTLIVRQDLAHLFRASRSPKSFITFGFGGDYYMVNNVKNGAQLTFDLIFRGVNKGRYTATLNSGTGNESSILCSIIASLVYRKQMYDIISEQEIATGLIF